MIIYGLINFIIIKKDMKKTFIVPMFWIIFWLLVAWITQLNFNPNQDQSEIFSQSLFIADFNDTTKVVGSSDNVFIVNITDNLTLKEKVKKKSYETLYNGTVVWNIKWSLEWNIILSLGIGYDSKGNQVIPEWIAPLDIWKTYIVSTKWSEPYVILEHKNGYSEINKENITSVIKKYIKAYENETLYEWDLSISSGKNLYKNLSKIQKEKIQTLWEKSNLLLEDIK